MDLLENQQALAGYFADCLLDAKYPSGLDEAGYETIRQDLIDRINREITQIIFDNLSSNQLEEIEIMLEEGDFEALSDVLRTAIPDLRQLILQRLIDIKSENT